MNLKPWYNFLLFNFVVLFVLNFLFSNLTPMIRVLQGSNAIIDFKNPFFTALFTAIIFVFIFRNRNSIK